MSSPDNTIRLGGLASGFDTDAIIEQILAVDQAKIDGLSEDKEINLAKIDTWTQIQDQLSTFAATVTALKSDGTGTNTLFDNKKVGSTLATAVSGSATSDAPNGTYTVSITNKARAHVVYGDQQATTYTNGTAGTFVLNTQTITLAGGETLAEIAELINAETYPSGEEIVATVIDDRLTLQTLDTGASATVYGSAPGAPPFGAGDDPNNILQNELDLITGGGNFQNVAQTSIDASITVNGVPITDESNSIEAVSGLTINLLADTGSAELTVSNDTDAIKSTLNDLITLYNETRDLIKRVREVKLEDDDLFGLFASDPLMRQIFNEVRALTTGGVTMASGDWDGSVNVQANGIAGDTTMTVQGLTTGGGSLLQDDFFTIEGHTTTYRVTQTAAIAGGQATITIDPPLEAPITVGDEVRPAVRTMEDIGIGVRTDVFSGTEGIVGILDEGKLDTALATDIETIEKLFNRSGTVKSEDGVARRLFDFIDSLTKISAFTTKTRTIDDITIPSIEDINSNIDTQVARLQQQLDRKRVSLIQQFTEMENAISQAQATGGSLTSLASGG